MKVIYTYTKPAGPLAGNRHLQSLCLFDSWIRKKAILAYFKMPSRICVEGIRRPKRTAVGMADIWAEIRSHDSQISKQECCYSVATLIFNIIMSSQANTKT
jgi:hypothetical protein